MYIRNAAGSSDLFSIKGNGNVGVGTTSPSEKLSIATSTNASAEIGYAHVGYIGHNTYAGFSHVDQNTTLSYAFLQGSNGETYINAPTGQNVNFRINNSTHMVLNSSGNIGIGTTSPQQKLDVVGYTRTTTLEANGLTGSINLGYGANFKGGLFNDQYLTGDPANSVNDFVTYAPTKYHITVGTTTNKVITVDSSNNVDIDGNIHVGGSTRLDSGGGQQPGFLQNQTPVDAIVRSGGAPEVYLSEPDEWLIINIAGTDYVIPAYLP